MGRVCITNNFNKLNKTYAIELFFYFEGVPTDAGQQKEEYNAFKEEVISLSLSKGYGVKDSIDDEVSGIFGRFQISEIPMKHTFSKTYFSNSFWGPIQYTTNSVSLERAKYLFVSDERPKAAYELSYNFLNM